jgi:hypothetical protein
MTNFTTMTNFTARMMIAAATVVVAGGVASAQGMKAEIPFTFRAGNKVMAAGTYQVTRLSRISGGPAFRIANYDAGVAIIALPYMAADASKSWLTTGDPLLAFECTDGRCALTGLWAGRGHQAYVLYRPRAGKNEPVQIVSVAMRPDRVE